MEKWARRYGSRVQFLMVCVDGARVAIEFGRMFDLKAVVNCYIPSRGYMPVGFGQLGCSGFIISDEKGYFVSRKTRAYLQYGELAFDHVEQILEKNCLVVPARHEVLVEEEKKVDEDVLSKNWVMPSVGIQTMDEEHELCEGALSLMLLKPNTQTLTKVMEALTEHFQHEEELMKQAGFGRPGEPFSPYANHVKDHERILDIGYVELAKKSEPNKSFLNFTCSETQLNEPYKSFVAMTCSDVSDEKAV
mmetsp:Transcript_28558/g.42629  ORF Transcript_28558/g.42629 Transcript_28558/m.42629 type:complete len:248 (+) Transcript_28558:162-905(+)